MVDNYSLLNLYAGLRSQDGAWEVTMFAKNIFETNKQLSLDANQYVINGAPETTFLGTPANSTRATSARATPRRVKWASRSATPSARAKRQPRHCRSEVIAGRPCRPAISFLGTGPLRYCWKTPGRIPY